MYGIVPVGGPVLEVISNLALLGYVRLPIDYLAGVESIEGLNWWSELACNAVILPRRAWAPSFLG